MKKLLAVLLAAFLILSLFAACEKSDPELLVGSTLGSFNKEQEIAAAKKLAETLNGKTVKITAETGVDGKFFGSVTAKEIAAAIEEEFDVTIDRRMIQCPEIKKTGSFDFKVNIYTGITAKMTVVVE